LVIAFSVFALRLQSTPLVSLNCCYIWKCILPHSCNDTWYTRHICS